jgi:hypothetical protein
VPCGVRCAGVQNTALDAVSLVDGVAVAIVQDACSAEAVSVLTSAPCEALLDRANIRIVQAADVLATAADGDAAEESTGT